MVGGWGPVKSPNLNIFFPPNNFFGDILTGILTKYPSKLTSRVVEYIIVSPGRVHRGLHRGLHLGD